MRKFNKQCMDCNAPTSSIRCKPCAIRESASRRGVKGHPPTGPKHHSEETRKKISASGVMRWSGFPKKDKGIRAVRKDKEIRICEICKKDYVMTSGSRPERRTCGKSCGTKLRGFGENHPNWTGGRSISAQGYVMVRVDRKVRPEHHIVMEKSLGRKLLPNENVHHKDRNRANNDISNLELWTTGQPMGGRVGEAKHCPTCTCSEHNTLTMR